MTGTRVKPPKVSDPIVFQAQKDGPEHVVRPCSGRHREMWLSNYIVLSCGRCKITKPETADQESSKGDTQ